MEATINALGQLLLQALPTFFLVLVLHFYLKAIFFKPLAKTLAERHEATEGAREAARLSLARAEEKAAAYEQSIREARNEVYREQEETRRRWLDDQASQLAAARQSAQAIVVEARTTIAAEADAAKRGLAEQTESLAEQIIRSVLEGKAA